jgi:hypothetical protein
MTFAASRGSNLSNDNFLQLVKSFSIWTFTILICYLIVGFPVFFLMVFIASLLATALQPILATSAALWVAGGFISLHLLAMMGGAAMLTARGIHPENVSWLNWAESKSSLQYSIAYPACPLTCALNLGDA